MSTITAAIWLLAGEEDSLVWVFCAYWLAPNLKLQGLACWCVIYTQMLGTVVCGPIGGLWWVVKTVGNAGEMDLASLLIQWQVFTCYTARTIIDPRCRAEVTMLALLCICIRMGPCNDSPWRWSYYTGSCEQSSMHSGNRTWSLLSHPSKCSWVPSCVQADAE